MRKLLIVIDMQNDFVDGALGTKEAVAILPNVVKKIREHTGDIIVTKDTHLPDYLDTQEGKKLPVLHCIKDTYGWELNKSVLKALSDKEYTIFEKPTFGSVEMARAISARYGEDFPQIELIGLCTDICVVSNALLLKANFPEASILVDPSCCAGVTPHTHDAALMTMRMCQIDIL